MNNLTKQTVYLPVNEANLEENYLQDLNGDFYLEQKGYFLTSEQLNEYTQSVIKQSLESAAENAECKAKLKFECNSEDLEKGFTSGQLAIIVNKKTITNTFEENFKKFEV